MEGSQERLSGEGEIPLSVLYPPLPSDYFKDKGDVLVPIWPHHRRRVVPYIRRRDLNASEDGGKPVYAWEIGIKGTF